MPLDLAAASTPAAISSLLPKIAGRAVAAAQHGARPRKAVVEGVVALDHQLGSSGMPYRAARPS
jgi:hypothetical protein